MENRDIMEMPVDKCGWCAKGKQHMCNDHNGERRLYCTRPVDHDGDHAACGMSTDEHPILRWNKDRVITYDSDDIMEVPACGDCGEDVRTDDGPACSIANRLIKREDFDEKATHPRWCPLVAVKLQ